VSIIAQNHSEVYFIVIQINQTEGNMADKKQEGPRKGEQTSPRKTCPQSGDLCGAGTAWMWNVGKKPNQFVVPKSYKPPVSKPTPYEPRTDLD